MAEPAPLDFASARDVALYDELPLWSSLAGELLLESVTLTGVTRALDLGCGTGFPLVELAERLGGGVFVAGLDPWSEGLARARDKVARWRVRAAAIRGTGNALPFRSESLDLVVSNLGVNNFDDAAGALQECRRVLKPGGILGLSSNLVGHMHELYDAFERVLAGAGDGAALARLERHVAHRATVESLRASLAAGGFKVTMVRERDAALRFANADALFSHHFIRLGFRPAWEEIASPESLAALRAELDRIASAAGELRLTIPLAYLEARRIP